MKNPRMFIILFALLAALAAWLRTRSESPRLVARRPAQAEKSPGPEAPRVLMSEITLPFLGKPVKTELVWVPVGEANTYLIEGPDLKEETADNSFPITLDREGESLFHIRSKSGQGVSAESTTIRVSLLRPELLPKPLLPVREIVLDPAAPSSRLIDWFGPPGSRRYVLAVNDALTHQPVLREEVAASAASGHEYYSLPSLPVGLYSYQVTAYDKWGRPGEASRWKEFQIGLSTATLRTERTEEVSWFRQYQSGWSFELEGFLGTTLSSPQLSREREASNLGSVGLNVCYWQGNNGVSMKARTKAFGTNPTGNEISPTAFEARAGHRWLLSTEFIKHIAIGLFGGGEVARNSGSADFLSAYQILKAGTTLRFAIDPRWSTGGEFVAGVNFGSTRKFEISGDIQYRFGERWRVGAGYRAYILESNPITTPATRYREGGFEGFSSLGFNY